MIRGIVAIIGRPNVGKSTLFNRLTVSDDAIVDDRPGVTRDRLYGTVWLDGERTQGYAVIDTGGFETDDFKFQPFAENLVWKQTDAAIQEADLVVLVVDAKAGINPHDRELAQYLDRLGKHHMVVVNKVDGLEQSQLVWDFYELSEDPRKVSAAHNRGVADLRDDIGDLLNSLPGRASIKHEPGATRIAIVGRPNAGKSSILNRLTGEERALVSDIAGTTRDAIDTPMTYHGQPYILVDTAGIRRKSRIHERIESLSVVRSIRAIERADVVLLVMDAREGLTEQDMRLAQLAAERWKPIVLVINKWDLVENKTSNTGKEWTDAIHRMLKTLAFAPVAFISCLENQRVHKLMGQVESLALNSRRRVETHLVNQALRKMVQEHTPALIKGKTKRVKFYFATQVAVEPPTIVVFCNVAKEIHASYIRYMTHRFQELLGFDDIPLRIIFRPKADVRARPGSKSEEDIDVAEADVTEVEAHVYEEQDESDSDEDITLPFKGGSGVDD
jgi:GTP-binding protein